MLRVVDLPNKGDYRGSLRTCQSEKTIGGLEWLADFHLRENLYPPPRAIAKDQHGAGRGAAHHGHAKEIFEWGEAKQGNA